MKNNIHIPLGIFPSGTCNDFARSIRISDDLDSWIDTILAGNIQKLDAGVINEET